MFKNNLKKIVLVGCTEYGYNLYKPLFDNNEIKVSAIVTLDEEQAKKYNVSGYKDLSVLSDNDSIEVYYPKSYNLKDSIDIEFFRKHQFDLMIMGGWQRLIPSNIIDLLKFGGLGLHGSSELLPKGRGRSPVNWSIIEGKKRFLIHLFFLNSDVDSGDIIDVENFDINDFDTCKTIYYKISILSRKMIASNIQKIFENSVNIIKQQGKTTHYPKRTPEDGLINWDSMDVFQIHNFVRALTKPYPGAFTFFNNKKILIWEAQIFDTRIIYYGKKEGEIVEVFDSGDFVINCAGGTLLVLKYSNDFEPKIGCVFN